MPGASLPSALGTSISTCMVRVDGSSEPVVRVTLPGKVMPSACTWIVAVSPTWTVPARDSGTGSRRRRMFDLGEFDDRHGARVRGAGLNERAGVRVPPRHDAIEWSGDARVVRHRGVALLVRLRDAELLLRGGQCRLCGIDLRCRLAVLRFGVVELLLGDQAGPGVGRLLQTLRRGVQGVIVRLGTQHIALRAVDLVLDLAYARVRALRPARSAREYRASRGLVRL